MDKEQIKDALSDRNLRRVAEASGVNYFTLCRFMNGTTQNPEDENLDRLRKYLGEK